MSCFQGPLRGGRPCLQFWVDMLRSKVFRWICSFMALAVLALALDFSWRDSSYPDEKRRLRGVSNFGQVAPRLYRGGQPSNEGLESLRTLGVDTVISFTLGEEGAKAEAAEAARLGMDYVGLPWSTEELPEPDQVETFLSYIRQHPDLTIFVHCKAGADRTGVMIALWRIGVARWPAQRAIDEMNAFHYHSIFLPHLQRFVQAFRTRPGPGS